MIFYFPGIFHICRYLFSKTTKCILLLLSITFYLSTRVYARLGGKIIIFRFILQVFSDYKYYEYITAKLLCNKMFASFFP